MSEKKSPPRKEKPTTVKTPSKPEQKAFKRKLFSGSGPDEEEKKGLSTPKRKKSIASESSPSPAVSAAKTPGSINWPSAPLSERQQMALLMKMTAESQQQQQQQHLQQQQPGGDSNMSPRPSSPSTPLLNKKTPQDKKVHKRNERGETALHIAAIKGDAKQTKRLIKAGADVNVRDFAGWTPLHEACNHGWLDVAKQLLKAGANVNVQGLDNDTPLHDASINGHSKLVELLLRHGANPLQPNTKGQSPLDVAASPSITQLLKKEIISSSSESSGLDEIRSPTSPESNLSDRDFEKDFDHRDVIRNSPSPGVNCGIRHLDTHLANSQLSMSRRASAGSIGSMAKSPDKINSPRLTLKFQPIRTKDDSSDSRKSRVSKDHPFKSYSVRVEEGESEHASDKQNSMLPDSVSGQGCDFFDSSSDNPATHKFLDLFTPNVSSEDNKNFGIGSSSDVSTSVGRGRLSPSFHRTKLEYRPSASCSDQNKDKNKGKQEKDPYAFEDISDEEEKVSIKLRTDRNDHKSDTSRQDRTDLHHHHHHHHHIPDCVRPPVSMGRPERHLERDRFEERLSFDLIHHQNRSRSRSRSPISEPNHHGFDKHMFESKHFDNKRRWKETDSLVSTSSERMSLQWKEAFKPEDITLVSEKEKLLKIDRDRESRSPKSDTSNRSSPKSDRESRLSPKSEKESRSSSPKVPPLKIIIPPKTPTTESDGNNMKKIIAKPAFPYVLNPTQEIPEGVLPMDTSQGLFPDGCNLVVPNFEQMVPVMDKESTMKDGAGETEKALKANSLEKSPVQIKEVKSPAAQEEQVVNEESGVQNDKNSVHGFKDEKDKDSVKSETKGEKNEKIEKQKDAPQRETRESARLKEKEMKERERELERQREKEKGQERPLKDVERLPKDSERQSKDVESKDVDVTTMINSSSNSSSSSSSSKKEEEKAGNEDQSQSQVSSGRCLRSQTKLQQQKELPNKDSSDSNSAHEKDSGSKKSDSEENNIHPRKRKLRQRQIEVPEQPVIPPPQHFEKPENPYELFLEIRKQVASRRKSMFAVQPKAPQGFKDYLMVSNNYILAGNTQSRLSVPMLSPPNSVQGPMREFFINQEKARYQLRLQHLIEREKLMLAIEQEILRVHGRAARAMANQSTPFSVCTVLREDEIYNTIDPDQDEKDKNVRSRYNGRQFLSWLQDVDDKYEKIKERLLLRHHHEAESLYAVQKMEWEWKLKEVGMCDYKLTPKVDDVCVPMVHVNDEFDLLPA